MIVLLTGVLDDGTGPIFPTLAADSRRPLHLHAGEDLEIRLSLFNQLGVRLDINLAGGDSVAVTARKQGGLGAEQLFRRLGVAVPIRGRGEYNIVVPAADTAAALNGARGIYDVRCRRSGLQHVVVGAGELHLLPSITGVL